MNTGKLILTAVFFVLTLVLGFWVRKTGKPYPAAVFTLHKLTALACAVFTVIVVINQFKLAPVQSQFVLWIVLVGFSVVALFSTGAVMSIQKTLTLVWVWIHRVAAILLTGSGIVLILQLLRK